MAHLGGIWSRGPAAPTSLLPSQRLDPPATAVLSLFFPPKDSYQLFCNLKKRSFPSTLPFVGMLLLSQRGCRQHEGSTGGRSWGAFAVRSQRKRRGAVCLGPRGKTPLPFIISCN